MDTGERTNKYISFAQIAASYLATISLLLLVQYHRAPKWKLFIDHAVRFSALLTVAVASSLFLLFVNRRKIFSLFGSGVIQYCILILAIVLGLYFRFPMLDLIVFLYTVYAILFIGNSLETNGLNKQARKLTNNILDVILDVESRTTAVLALLLLISLPFLLIFKKNAAAESIAIYAYYLLAITVILQILEVKQGIEKENRLLSLVTGGFGAVSRTLTDHERRSRMLDSARMLARQTFTKRNMVHGTVLLALLAGIYAVKSSYWKRVIHAVDSNAEYRSDISLNANDSGSYTFPSYVDEIKIPIKVKHPLSNPLWWTESGENAVRIKIVWFSGVGSTGKQGKVFETYQPIPRSLFIDESSNIQLQLKRPTIPVDRSYEVRVGLVFGKNKWFSVSSDNVLTLHVQMERLSGSKAIAHEHNMQSLMQAKVEEQWSDQLSSSQKDYRSKIEILHGNFLTPISTYSISVMNRGRLPWPAHNQHAVKVGVAWMKKIIEDGNERFIHLSEDIYALPHHILPGEKLIIDASIDPRKIPEADEIWIGLVHEGKTWFYNKGDGVLKLPSVKTMIAQQLSDLQKENAALEKALLALGRDRAAPWEQADYTSSFSHDDYRSKIDLVDHASTVRQLTVANKLPLDLELSNIGNVPWTTSDEQQVTLGVLWFNKSDKVSFDSPRIAEERCLFPFNVLKGMTIRMRCDIGANVLPGDYEVWIGLIHEHIAWFYEKGDSVLKLNVTVNN